MRRIFLPLMWHRWYMDGGRISVGMNGAALRVVLSLPLKAVGISLLKNTARIAARKWTEVNKVTVMPVIEGMKMRWIEDHDYIKCPKCGVMVKRDFTFFDIGDWNYCPNCGEPMEGGAENAVD